MQPQPPLTPEDAAADWLARRDAGLTPAEERELAAWLAADQRHAEAWAEAESLWQALDTTRVNGLADEMVNELAARQRRRRWKVQLGWAAGLAAAAAVAVMFLVQPAQRPVASQPDAALVVISRPERRVLEDGSIVELKRGAEIAVNYSTARRDVRLVRGAALFTVAKNPNRPFVVTGGSVEVRAVGTAFAVQLGDDAVDVLVTEGRVAVDRRTTAQETEAAAASVFVSAGDRLVVPTAAAQNEELQVEAISPDEMSNRLAWRGAQLDLSGTRLQDAVQALNRENQVRITVADSALAERRLSGIFDANNAEGFVRMLEADTTLDVVAERHADEIVLRSR